MIEENFDVSFIADLARREKQIQQNYRPIIAVHKWFARRPGTLFRGIILSEFGSKPLKELLALEGLASQKHASMKDMASAINLAGSRSCSQSIC